MHSNGRESTNLKHYKQDIIECTGGTFIKCQPSYLRYLNGDTSSWAVFCYLLNQLGMKLQGDADFEILDRYKYWFKCPAKKIQQDFGMSKDKQRRAIQVLSQAKIIEWDRRKGNCLWIRVNNSTLKKIDDWSRIESRKRETRLPESGKPDFRKAGNPTSGKRETRLPLKRRISSKESINKNCQHSVDRVNGFSSSLNGERHIESNGFCHSKEERKTSFEKEIAVLLHLGLAKAHLLKRKPIRLSSWIKEFVDLVNWLTESRQWNRKQAKQRIRQIIQDHVDHLKTEYQPQCHSAKSVCDRFPDLEAAFDRRIKAKTKTESNGHVHPDMIW